MQRRADLTLRRPDAGDLGVGGVAEEEVDTGVAESRHPGQVGGPAVGRKLIEFDVAGVQHAPVYAPKSALGHSIGAVGALESILTVLTLRDGVIPPTLNYQTPDPEIDLDVVAGEPRYGDYRYAINNSFGFGGHNVALAFGRY